ncbi:MAG: porin [Chthoniobacterales bacterium]|nr:porin [Chthoniobacterales bacterium]
MKRTVLTIVLLVSSIPLGRAGGTNQPPPTTAAEKPMEMMNMPMESMWSPEPGFRVLGWLEAGLTANLDSPSDRQNFGRLLDDRSNEPLLNQLVVRAERGPDPKMSDQFDWGFRAQLFYGSDARYLHSTGLLDLTTNDTEQPDIPEAWILAHFPLCGTSGGLDVRLGKFMNCFGADMSDPRMNVFYSHTYIFNFGCPFYGTGALVTLHARPWLDLYASVDRGLNVTLDDNNDSVSFYGGVGMNCCNGKVCCAALTHIGPEDPGDNHDLRYLSDITTTWKITDKLTSITDLNYVYEEAAEARGYGIAQYLTYTVNDCCSVSLRGEVWRDEDGFFVAQFASNNDFLHFARGDDTVFAPRTVGGGSTTYAALTAGVSIKPPVPKPFTGLTIRPELRYDRSLSGTRPFNDSSERDMLTAAVDVVLTF